MIDRLPYFSVRALGAGGTLFFTLIFSLKLTAYDFTEVALIFVLAQGAALICRQGLDRSLQLLLPKAAYQERRAMLRAAFSSLLRASLLLLPLFGALLVALGQWIPLGADGIVCSMILALPIAFIMVLGGGLLGSNRPVIGSLREPGISLFLLSCVYTIVEPFSPYRPWQTCALAFLVLTFVIAVVLACSLDMRRALPPGKTSDAATGRAGLGELRAHNRAFTLTAVSEFLINTLVPFVIAAAVSPVHFEVFRVIERVASAAAFPVYLADGFFPQQLWIRGISDESWVRLTLARARNMVRRMLLLALVPICIFMAGWNWQVQELGIREWIVFAIVLFGYGVNCYYGVEPYRLFVHGQAALWGRVVAGSAVFHVFAAVFLSQLFGIVGAAMAYAIGISGRYLIVALLARERDDRTSPGPG